VKKSFSHVDGAIKVFKAETLSTIFVINEAGKSLSTQPAWKHAGTCGQCGPGKDGIRYNCTGVTQ
jgi:hypothetical protein